MSDDCGCCEGTQGVTPLPTANRPGLDALTYRIGTHSSFLETMLARLSTLCDDTPERCLTAAGNYPLRERLTTRKPDDPSIAMLDAWAIVGDVLTFYQERIANEGFLRTAAQRRSIHELARLVGYMPRPGLSASVHLAFEVEIPPSQSQAANPQQPPIGGIVLVPGGTACKSTPAPGSDDRPQAFETTEDLRAYVELNALRPKRSQPQRISAQSVVDLGHLYFQGIGLQLAANDLLAIVVDPQRPPFVTRISEVEEIAEQQITLAKLPRDVLSPAALRDDIARVVSEFPAPFPNSGVNYGLIGEPTVIQTILKHARKKIECATSNGNLKSLQAMDNHFKDFACPHELTAYTPLHGEPPPDCARLLTGAVTPTPSIIGFVNELKVWADELVSRLEPLHGVLDVAPERETYQLAVRKVLNAYKDLDAFARGLLETLNSQSGLMEAIGRVRSALLTGLGGTATSPRLVLTTSPLPTTYVLLGQLPVQIESDGVAPPQMSARISIETQAAGELDFADTTLIVRDGPASREIVLKAAAGETPGRSEFNVALKNVQLVVPGSTTDARWAILFRLYRSADAAPGTELAAGWIELKVGNPPASSFPIAIVYRTSLRRHDAASTKEVDPDFAFAGADLATPGPFAVRFSVVANPDAQDLFEADLSGLSGITANPAAGGSPFELQADGTVTLASLVEAIKRVTFRGDPSITPGIRTILIEFFQEQTPAAGAAAVSIALRDVVFQEYAGTAVMERVARLHAELTEDTLNQVRQDFETETLPGDITAPSQPDTVSKRARDVVQDLIDAFAVPLPPERTALDDLQRLEDSVRESVKGDRGLEKILDALPASTAFVDSVNSLMAALAASDLAAVDDLEAARTKAVLALENLKSKPLDVKDAYEQLIDVMEFLQLNVLNTAVPGPLKQAIEHLQDLQDQLNKVAVTVTAHSEHLGAQTEALAVEILGQLFQRRGDLITRILGVHALDGGRFARSSVPVASTDDAATRTGKLLFTLEDDLRKGLAKLQKTSRSVMCGIPGVAELVEEIDRQSAQGGSATLQELVGQLNGDDQLAVKLILRELTSLREQVAPAGDLVPDASATDPPPQDLEQVLNKLDELHRESNATRRERLLRDLSSLFSNQSDLLPRVAQSLDRDKWLLYYQTLKHRRVRITPEPKVFVFRRQAQVFGWNAPTDFEGSTFGQLFGILSPGIVDFASLGSLQANLARLLSNRRLREQTPVVIGPADDIELGARMFLDGAFEATTSGSVIAVDRPNQPVPGGGATDIVLDPKPTAFLVDNAKVRPRSAYGLAGRATMLELERVWWQPAQAGAFEFIRRTQVYCDPEKLELAEEPVLRDLTAGTSSIEMDGVYEGLSTGKQLLVTGTPTSVAEDLATLQSEHVHIIGVTQRINEKLHGDRFRTVVQLERPLANNYQRESVRIYGNVVAATHGESLQETLGNGNNQAFARYTIKSPPLTRLPAATSTGTENVLDVFVNNVRWTERPNFHDSQIEDQHFVPLANGQGSTTIVFGDGEQGARPPSGAENIRASYRSGLGRAGNVGAGRIDQLAGAPQGVKSVINALAASGGADPETRDAARANAPIAVTTMGRLVSTQDYADFAMQFAAIGMASASRLQGTVHLTVAGMDEAPIDQESHLWRNLLRAVRAFGDPLQQFEVHNRQPALLVIAARVKIDPNYQWEVVETGIREALIERFGYQQAGFGQDVLLSDAIRAMQQLEGVVYVDIDTFDAISQEASTNLAKQLANVPHRLLPRIHVPLARLAGVDAATRDQLAVTPAQICYLTPHPSDTLTLEQIP